MTTVFMLYDREIIARNVEIFATREGAEKRKQDIENFETRFAKIPEFRRRVLFIREVEVEE